MPAMNEMRKQPIYRSYAENGYMSPNSNTGSLSIPFNFTSDQDAYERSSMYNRSSQLRKAAASILSSSENAPFEKKTTVRIRGKQTEMTEGVIDKTLEEQEKYKSKQKEIRRANERLKTLEKLERYRQEKVKKEIERLEEERKMAEVNRELKRKEDMIKRRKIQQKKREIQAAKEEREVKRRMKEMKDREKIEMEKEKKGKGVWE